MTSENGRTGAPAGTTLDAQALLNDETSAYWDIAHARHREAVEVVRRHFEAHHPRPKPEERPSTRQTGTVAGPPPIVEVPGPRIVQAGRPLVTGGGR